MQTITGQTVMIYEDPITEVIPEEKALLLEYLGNKGTWEGRQFEHWKVRFADGFITERSILV